MSNPDHISESLETIFWVKKYFRTQNGGVGGGGGGVGVEGGGCAQQINEKQTEVQNINWTFLKHVLHYPDDMCCTLNFVPLICRYAPIKNLYETNFCNNIYAEDQPADAKSPSLRG